MVFSISHRSIFTSAIQPVFSFKDENSNHLKSDFHTHSYHLVCRLECVVVLNIWYNAETLRTNISNKEAHDQTVIFRWPFSTIATKLLIYLMQLINSVREAS